MALTPYEDYAKCFGRLHPRCQEILAPFFDWRILADTRVKVLDNHSNWLDAVGFRGCMVLRGVITVVPGLLDADEKIHNVTWSWTQPIGIANWAHEVVHVQQWLEHPGVVLRQYLKGLAKSWWKGKWYIHGYFPYEQEAFYVEKKVREYYQKKESR